MCGIAGILTTERLGDLRRPLERMLLAEAHRGPDDSGSIFLGDNEDHWRLALGSRRLSILDLSSAGHQPMSNECKTVWAVYNGEVYNFLDLRAEITKLGYRFRSKTDTEVLVHGYEQWGIEGLLSRIEGMFTFSLWDTRTRRLFIARDRLGKKPLYYWWNGRSLVFASELKALIASGLIQRRLNPEAVIAYLTFGCVPGPLSMIEGVKTLPPACLMTLQARELKLKRYWKLEFEDDPSLDETRAAEGVRDLLERAVACRLVSDVPVGIFLSGGLDSSALVAAARRRTSGKLRTCSVVFREREFNEAPFANLVAQRFATEHSTYEVGPRDVLSALARIIWAMDQPTNDGVNTYFVSGLTRHSGTVVALSGLGGDELFGGYPSFHMVPKLRQMSSLLGVIPGASRTCRGLLRLAPEGRRSAKLRAFLGENFSPEMAYLAVRGLFLNGDLLGLLSREFLAGYSGGFEPLASIRQSAEAIPVALKNRVSQLELRTYMHNQLLRDTDVMSMAHSLEVRVPFLDHRLVEFVARIPAAVKFRYGRPKSLLLSALDGMLPPEITTRAKTGFAFPFDRWLRGELRPLVEDEMYGNGGEWILDRNAVISLWHRFLKGRVHWTTVWAVVVLKLWLRGHLTADAAHVAR